MARILPGRRLTVREIRPGDYPRVIALNLASEAMLSPLDLSRLEWIVSMHHRSVVVESHGAVVAFALSLRRGTAYDSRNYEWFAANLNEFLYLDRIVVDSAARRQGIATLIYDEVEAIAAPFRRMVCDVNLVPPNTASLAFHTRRGYMEMARLTHPRGRVAAMLSKDLGASPRVDRLGAYRNKPTESRPDGPPRSQSGGAGVD